jgi:4-diphosphocytidyl-2-C-methyl-D-erythritol kinase
MSVHRALAPAKVNLGLFLGPARDSDGRHELVTVMQSISLADELTLETLADGAGDDEIVCPGVEGPASENLAASALRAFRRRTGWEGPPVRLTIDKRIPVAAGLGGGSADAAAALRLAQHVSGLGDLELLLELAGELGADVPAQVAPGRWLATGAGEELQALPAPRTQFALLVLPAAVGLSTAAVYTEADRLGLPRSRHELHELCAQLSTALEHGAPVPAATELLHNDLQRAAVSLQAEIAQSLRQAREAGAELALVSGSGPTVVGLFGSVGRQSMSPMALAELAASALLGREPAPLCAAPVDADFGRPQTLQAAGARTD